MVLFFIVTVSRKVDSNKGKMGLRIEVHLTSFGTLELWFHKRLFPSELPYESAVHTIEAGWYLECPKNPRMTRFERNVEVYGTRMRIHDCAVHQQDLDGQSQGWWKGNSIQITVEIKSCDTNQPRWKSHLATFFNASREIDFFQWYVPRFYIDPTISMEDVVRRLSQNDEYYRVTSVMLQRVEVRVVNEFH